MAFFEIGTNYSRKLRFRVAHRCAWRSGASFRTALNTKLKPPQKWRFKFSGRAGLAVLEPILLK